MENGYIIAGLLVLLVFLILKEIQRKNKANLILRITASCLAIIALIFIAIPLTYQKKQSQNSKNSAVLISEGFQKGSLDTFKNIPAFSTLKLLSKNNKSVKLIPDLAGFIALNPEYSKFYILGYGLEDSELELLKNMELVFLPSTLPAGLQAIDWNRNLHSGEELRLIGTFKNTRDKAVKLILNGLGSDLDSITIPAGSKRPFELKTIPKQLDKSVYLLYGIIGQDTVMNEKVPVFIQSQTSLKILMLSSSPDFETRFLKNWLFENQYSLALRSAISKNKFSTEFLNISRLNLNRITPSILKIFDLLIIDLDELSSLSREEKLAVQNQLGDGMGLLIYADSIKKGSGFFNNIFESRNFIREDEKKIKLKWNSYSANKMTLPGSAAFKIVSKEGNLALVRDEKGNALVSSKLYGRGRILLSSILDTYTWVLGNDLKSYSSYWSQLIEHATRKTELNSTWTLSNPIILVNQENQIILNTLSDSIPAGSSDGELLKFAQDPILGFQWMAPVWPRKTGWNSLDYGNKNALDSSRSWYYVFDKNDWALVQASRKIKNTLKQAEQSFSDTHEQIDTNKYYREKISSIYFFILFILSCTYLWLEAKKF